MSIQSLESQSFSAGLSKKRSFEDPMKHIASKRLRSTHETQIPAQNPSSHSSVGLHHLPVDIIHQMSHHLDTWSLASLVSADKGIRESLFAEPNIPARLRAPQFFHMTVKNRIFREPHIKALGSAIDFLRSRQISTSLDCAKRNQDERAKMLIALAPSLPSMPPRRRREILNLILGIRRPNIRTAALAAVVPFLANFEEAERKDLIGHVTLLHDDHLLSALERLPEAKGNVSPSLQQILQKRSRSISFPALQRPILAILSTVSPTVSTTSFEQMIKPLHDKDSTDTSVDEATLSILANHITRYTCPQQRAIIEVFTQRKAIHQQKKYVPLLLSKLPELLAKSPQTLLMSSDVKALIKSLRTTEPAPQIINAGIKAYHELKAFPDLQLDMLHKIEELIRRSELLSATIKLSEIFPYFSQSRRDNEFDRIVQDPKVFHLQINLSALAPVLHLFGEKRQEQFFQAMNHIESLIGMNQVYGKLGPALAQLDSSVQTRILDQIRRADIRPSDKTPLLAGLAPYIENFTYKNQRALMDSIRSIQSPAQMMKIITKLGLGLRALTPNERAWYFNQLQHVPRVIRLTHQHLDSERLKHQALVSLAEELPHLHADEMKIMMSLIRSIEGTGPYAATLQAVLPKLSRISLDQWKNITRS